MSEPTPTRFLMLHCSSSRSPEGQPPCDTMVGVSLPLDDGVLEELEEAGWLLLDVGDDGKIKLLPTCPACATARGIDQRLAQAIGRRRRRDAARGSA